MAFFINVVRIAAAISVEIDGSFLNSTILKMLGLPFPYKLNGVSYITFVSKTVFKNWSLDNTFSDFFFLELLFVSINLPSSLAWNIVFMSELVFLIGTCIC